MTDKVSVSEIAKELGIASKDVLEKAKSMGIEVKAAQSKVSMEQAEEIANFIMSGGEVETSKPEPTTETKAKRDAPKEEAAIKEEAPQEVTASKVDSTQKETPSSDEVKTSLEVTQNIETEVVKKDETSKSTLKLVTPVIKTGSNPTGLRIVKKRKPVVEEKEQIIMPKKQTSVSSYGKMSAEVLEELAKKKKSGAKQSSSSKKEQGTKIDMFGGSMTEVSMDMDDQVVLLDLNATERAPLPAEEIRKPRPPKPIGRNANKKATPRGRKVRKDTRKKYVKV